MIPHRRRALAMGLAAALGCGAAEAQLVALERVDPTIQQAMLYATPHNFTGRPAPGYRDRVCLLTLKTACALARAQRRVRRIGLSLVVFDCYRPRRAVAAFVRWSRRKGVDATPSARRYAPKLRARDLIAKGYLAARSGHSRGHTVDVGLAPIGAQLQLQHLGGCRPDRATLAGVVDMGGGFDCLDPRSGARAKGLTPLQRRRRAQLRHAMTRAGFRPYWREWWHYSYPDGDSGVAFDLPVAKPAKAGDPLRCR
ncbi:MAG: hypothetical protein MRY74_03920 [Neomegalonema sp.]|nr:hypothetical protein [Neomegalonema sp.]